MIELIFDATKVQNGDTCTGKLAGTNQGQMNSELYIAVKLRPTVWGLAFS